MRRKLRLMYSKGIIKISFIERKNRLEIPKTAVLMAKETPKEISISPTYYRTFCKRDLMEQISKGNI